MVKIYCCSQEIPFIGGEDLFHPDRFVPERDRGGALQRCARILRENPLMTPLLRAKLPSKLTNGFQPASTFISADRRLHSDSKEPVISALTCESQQNLYNSKYITAITVKTSPMTNGVAISGDSKLNGSTTAPWHLGLESPAGVFELIDSGDGVWETLL